MKDWPTTGIHISGGIKLQSTARKSSGNGMIYLRALYLFLGMAGMLLTVQEAFGLKIQTRLVLSVLAFYCLVMGFVQLHGGKWQFLLYGWNTVLFLMGLFRWKQVLSGYFAAENGVRNQLSNYYNMNLAQRKLPVEGEQGEFFLFLAVTLLVAVLGRLVIRKGRTALLALIQVLIFSLELLCGYNFCGMGIYLEMCSILALLAMGNQVGGRSQQVLYRTGVWAGGMILTLVLVSGMLIGPFLFKRVESLNEKLYNTMQMATTKISNAMSSQNGLFGNHTPTADGSLNNYGVDQDEETDLRITVSEKPESTMYLRGFIGDTYEGTYWHRIDQDVFEQTFPQKDGAYQIQNILYRYIGKQANVPEGTVQLERIRPGGDYGYVPYGFESPDDANLNGDSYYSSAEKQMKYRGYVNWRKWLGSGAAPQPESEMEKMYREYVADQYLKIPVHGLERLKKYCGEQNFNTVQEVIDFVVPAVKEGRSYSMDLEPVPEGKDFAEYFFFDQKKGYCIHYATTAVLMFRMMGVPARYATGYVIAPEAFSESEHGYTADIPDSQAHAWVEVYRAGKGWIPVEVTPGYENPSGGGESEEFPGQIPEETEQNIPQPTPEEAEQGTQQPGQGETEQGSQQTKPEETEQGTSQPTPGQEGSISGSDDFRLQNPQNIQGDNPLNVPGTSGVEGQTSEKILAAVARGFLILLAAAAVAALGIGGIRANRRRILKKRRRMFFQKDRNRAVCEISYGLYQMLWDAGIQEQDTGDVGYARRMETKLGILEKGEYVTFIRLAQRAAYGSEQVTQEERDACLEFYHKIAGYLWQQMTGRKKFHWKYMKCYEIS